MSASREKKQRRTSDAPLSTPRAREEQEKAAKRKRNTIIYTVIGVIAVILVAALLVWDSGIIQRNAAVATIDGRKVTAPQVLYYYQNNGVVSTAQMYAQIGMTYPYYSLYDTPQNQEITEEAIEGLGLDESYLGKTFHDYFLDNALNQLRMEYALAAAAKEAGYTLSAEGKASVEEAMASLDSSRESYLLNYGVSLSRDTYLQQIYGKQMNASAYRACLENAYLANEYYTAGFDTFAGYSVEELKAYYQEHQDDLDTIAYYRQLFTAEVEGAVDEDGNVTDPTEEETAAAMEAALEAAEEAKEQVEDDPDSVKDNDDFTDMTGMVSSLSSSSVYYDWLMDSARKPGDAEIFDSGSDSYYLVVYGDRYLNETPTVDVRNILVSAMPEDDPETEDVDESAEAPSAADFEAAKAEAERILAEWRAGEATEESFAALAEQYSADAASNTNGGLYEQIPEGYKFDAFNDWSFDSARRSGDVTSQPIQDTVSTTQGWHLIYYVGENDPVWMNSARSGLWSDEIESTIEVVRTSKLDSLFT